MHYTYTYLFVISSLNKTFKQILCRRFLCCVFINDTQCVQTFLKRIRHHWGIIHALIRIPKVATRTVSKQAIKNETIFLEIVERKIVNIKYLFKKTYDTYAKILVIYIIVIVGEARFGIIGPARPE